MILKRISIVSIYILFFFLPICAASNLPYPVALFSFSERGIGIKGYGDNVRDLLFAGLLENPDIILVERAELDKILTETELSLSGIIASDQAMQVGRMTGAKILITGSVFQIDRKIYIVAKIIGTETGRVTGVSVNGTEELDALTARLARDINKSLAESAGKLLPPPRDRNSSLERIRSILKGRKIAPVIIDIEERHMRGNPPDPAAETEMIYLINQLGGQVIDKQKGTGAAEYRISGEGLSEFSTRTKNLVSVKARLEAKILDRQGNILAADRVSVIKVGLNEFIAAKEALQEAADIIAERLIPKLVSSKQR